MSSQFSKLMLGVEVAHEKLLEANGERDDFIAPILYILGCGNGGVSSCSVYGSEVHITKSGSCRGYGWDQDYVLPLEMFTCHDPLAAAARYISDKSKAEERQKRQSKLAEIERLQRELDANDRG